MPGSTGSIGISITAKPKPSRMLKKSSSFVLGSSKILNVALRVRLQSTQPAALLDELFEHPARSSPLVQNLQGNLISQRCSNLARCPLTDLSSGKLEYHSPFRFCHRLDREAGTFSQQDHTLQLRFLPQSVERQTGLERLTMPDVHHIPPWSRGTLAGS